MKSKKYKETELSEVFQQYVPPLQSADFCLLSRLNYNVKERSENLLRRAEKGIFDFFVCGLEGAFGQPLYRGATENEYPTYGIPEELRKLAEKVIEFGFIKTIRHHHLLNDEPKLFIVGSEYGNFLKNNSDSGGQSSSTANAASLKSRDDAFIKFLGETFERTSCAFYKKSDLTFSSFKELKRKGFNAVNPEDFAGFSKKQLEIENLLAKTRVFDNSILGWTWGKSLITGK